jgi:hypothetical protein
MPDAFSINGIEIDLKELEELERRVAAKKQRQAQSSSQVDCPATADDEKLEESFEKSLKISENGVSAENEAANVQQQPPPSPATMFLVIMSIFSILNQIYYKPTARS